MVVMPEELENIFKSRILPDFIETSVPSTNPKLVFFGGQPGSGKTTSVAQILDEQPNVFHLEGDLLRRYHPSFGIKNVGAGVGPSLTDAAIGVWLRGLLEFAFVSNRSILLEGTWWNSSQVLETTRLARMSDFEVEAFVLAVSPRESLLSLVDRFVVGGHFTRLWKHDRAVDGIPKTLESLQNVDVSVSARYRSGVVAGSPEKILQQVWDSSNDGEVEEARRKLLADALSRDFSGDEDVQVLRRALLDDARFGVTPLILQ